MWREMAAIGIVLSCGLAGGCSEGFNEEGDTGGRAIAPQEFFGVVRADVAPADEPRMYRVVFQWPEVEGNPILRIRTDKILAEIPASQRSFQHEVFHNQKIRYYFEALSRDGNLLGRASLDVPIPKDIELSAERDFGGFLNKSGQIEISGARVFMNGPLNLGSRDLKINTDLLIAESATIETFEREAKAEASKAGRSGGLVEIRAKRAMGRLFIAMRGEHGGDGEDGKPLARAGAGSLPGRGTAHCKTRDVYGVGPILMSNSVNPMKLLPPGCYCTKVGHPGGNGKNGIRGEPGGPAGAGGASGSALLIVEDAFEFSVETEVRPGDAGKFGKGGPGQIGGPAGRNSPEDACDGRVGINGTDGPQGPDGDPAPHGSHGEICIHLKSEKISECRK